MTIEPAGKSNDAKTWTIIIWALYIGGVVTGISAVIGVILAYIKRADLAGTPFESHVTSAIRTFWIAVVAGIVGAVLMLVLIGWLVLLAVGAWVLFRSVRGLVFAIEAKPIADPAGWL